MNGAEVEASDDLFAVTWPILPQRAEWTAPEATSEEKSGGGGGGISKAQKVSADAPPFKIPEHNYEYLDHTADIQIHGWGSNLCEAFASTVVGMFGYMVTLEEHDMCEYTLEVRASGHDIESLLFNFLDECLYLFHSDSFVIRSIEIAANDLDTTSYSLSATARGGFYVPGKHAQGTEVKAITYSNMQVINTSQSKADVYVIVDI